MPDPRQDDDPRLGRRTVKPKLAPQVIDIYR